MEKLLRNELHDMSEKIYELQQKTEHLTNGQRYAAINEIEKSIKPLRNDLRHLEHQLFTQQTTDTNIEEKINQIIKQIDELEDIKIDLTTRINTETEATRQELNDKVIDFMQKELSPIKNSIEANKKEVESVKKDINDLRIEIIKYNKEREIKEAARFDRFKIVITAVVGALAALSTLSLWLEPSIRILMQIFF